ncbi:DNA internalization-related competence protein ComEC/Rec2 [Vibrio coralliilyticus]|uniref:DNA internalization-related competence protein ComEC/Rec2 n=1 Tax=Vibrio coralliilyticus TaxID=190893 RepID=UPI000BAC25DB|nr:DNA internalization-related competence protein ComEC/Rec2 [Vibrio coralliilyticus]PAW01950.1 DNA internalization-related competence protein ComEC/Rec2 [Vibrio coralliilyticus]
MTLYLNYWTLISFSFLISTAQFWWYMPAWEWLFPCILTLILSIRSKSLRWCVGPVFACLILVIHSNLLRHQQAMLFQAGQDITINAEVDSFFKQISHGFQGEVVVRSINGEELNTFAQPRIRLASPMMLSPSDEIGARVRLKPIVGLLNDVGFDAEKYALQQRVVGRASVVIKTPYWTRHAGSTRYELYQQVLNSVEFLPSKGLILALTFGVRESLSFELKEQLKASGLSHLIAISGLHIGIVFYLGWCFGKLLLRLFPTALAAPFAIAMMCAYFYAWLAGFSIPTQRALWTCCLAVLLISSFKRLPASYKWLIILSWLLLIDPFAAASSGLWLSMWAVAIILVFDSLQNRLWSPWVNALVLQLTLVIGMTPIVAISFQGLSLASFAYNLIFVPWFSFVVVPLSLLALLAETVFNVSVFWQWVDITIEPVFYALSFADSSWVPLSHFLTVLFVGALLLLLFSTFLSIQGKALFILCALVWVIDWKEKPVWQVFVLDVGHGLAIVVKQGSRAIVYDTGIAWERSSIAAQVITPFLHYHGVSKLDMLIISHTDGDHAGGLEVLLRDWQPELLMASQQLSRAQMCLKGNILVWGELTLEFLWPVESVQRAYNPHSCVVRVSHPEYKQSTLLPGDIDAIVEWLLVRQPDALRSDVLVVPHHGSKTSSIPRFIEAVSPKVAIASSALYGKWRLPAPNVVKRYTDRDVQWFDTGAYGQVSVNFYSNHWKIDAIREWKGLAWYRQMLRKGVE